MSTAVEKLLQNDVKELNEQLYASYTRVMELLDEIKDLNKTVEDQADIIDELVEASTSGNSSTS